MHRRFRIESLEKRLLLAADAVPIRMIDGFPIATVDWQGQQVDMFAGRWMLRLDGYSGLLQDQQTRAAQAVARLGDTFKVDRFIGPGIFLVTAPHQMQPAEVQVGLSRVPGFVSITPDFRYELDLTPNDTFFTSQWGLHNTGQTGGSPDADIDAPEAWNTSTGSTSVVLGIADTGIDYNHPDLAANIWINPGEIPGNFVDDDLNGYVDDVRGFDFFFNNNNPLDDGDHGSHTGGIAGARGNNSLGVSGVGWNMKLMPLKIGSGGGVSGSAAVAAMYYVHNHKVRPTNPSNVVATNHSWGGTFYDNGMDFIISLHNTANIMTVASAGNNNSNNDTIPRYPASYPQPNVIAVANLTHSNLRSFDSNYGPNSVHLAAPGENVLSTVRVSSGSYAFLSGTSMSAPFVTGAVGVLASVAPSFTVAQLKNAILTSVDPVPAFNGLTITGGRLNLNNALALVAVPGAPAAPDLAAGSDTGQSAFDNITSDNTPTLQGVAQAGLTVKIYANGVHVGTGVAGGGGQWQVTTSPLADNVYNMTATLTNGIGEGGQSPPLQVTIDTLAPQVSNMSFNYLTSPHSLDVAFNENVGWSVEDSDFLVENLTTPGVVSSTGNYNLGNNTQTITFPGNPVLADADYRLTVTSSGIRDIAGNVLSGLVDPVHNFFFMMADADHDRRVNLNDFNIVAANFGQSNRDFGQGDFNYDGTTNLSDFNILAARFGNILAGPDARPGGMFGQHQIGSGRTEERGAGDPLDDLLA